MLLLVFVTALTACSLVRVAYEQAPNLVFWRIDSYVDVDGEQSPRLRDAIERWFAWHRRSELPVYAAMLSRAERDVMQPTTPAAVCAWVAEVEKRADIALEETVQPAAELMLTLTPEQLKHIERRFAKSLDEVRGDYLQANLAERQAKALERTQERYEMLYGTLDRAQTAQLAALLAKSSFDAVRWSDERRLRQRDTLQVLNSVLGATCNTSDRAAALQQARVAAQGLVHSATHSPRADYRNYQQRLLQDNCALAAAMHNAMSAAQRQTARAKLKGWEEDLRVLATAAPSAAPRAVGVDAALSR